MLILARSCSQALASEHVTEVVAGRDHSLMRSKQAEIFSCGRVAAGPHYPPFRLSPHSIPAPRAALATASRVTLHPPPLDAGGEARDELVPRRVTPASFEPSAATDCGGRCMRTTGGEIFSWGMPLTSAN